MPFFRALLSVKNLPGEIIGRASPVGFFVTRFVEATDRVAAEEAIRELLRSDAKFVQYFQKAPNAALVVEEMVEISKAQIPLQEQGLVWYPMD